MKTLHAYILLLVTIVMVGCTNEKTQYDSGNDQQTGGSSEFKEFYRSSVANYRVSFYALSGKITQGYNALQVQIVDTKTNLTVDQLEPNLQIISATGTQNQQPSAYSDQLSLASDKQFFVGYAVLPVVSSQQVSWTAQVSFTVKGQHFEVQAPLMVIAQENSNLSMTQFTGTDGQEYIIALVAPAQPKVANNELVAGVFKLEASNSPRYLMIQQHLLLLDPRMPDPNMGNHSSPNNRDLVQKEDTFYHGSVNYTMTGNWTLNFILLNPAQELIKGSSVATEHTPGVIGVKSDLFIDVKVGK